MDHDLVQKITYQVVMSKGCGFVSSRNWWQQSQEKERMEHETSANDIIFKVQVLENNVQTTKE
jgi:hypothetical protein